MKKELRAQYLAPTGSLPPEIKAAVGTLIQPYGLNIDVLLTSTPASEPSKKFFSVKEAEEYTGVSRYTLHRAVKSGELTVCKLSDSQNGRILIPIKELDRWLKTKLPEDADSEVLT